VDPEQFRIESVFDRVSTTGTVLMGLSMGCAQCHDHKFDPIPTKDYYSLLGIFNSSRYKEHPLAEPATPAVTQTGSSSSPQPQPHR
jgi:hypothetical protein